MKIFYSDKEELHKPRFEWYFGKRVPYPDKYSREHVVKKAFIEKGYKKYMFQPEEFPEHFLYQVHTEGLVNHIKECEERLGEEEHAYPHVFPYTVFEKENESDSFLAGNYCFDVGTYLTKYTYHAAKAAVDCALSGSKLILSNTDNRIFSICRPPGHHASSNFYGGYCIFNNAAIAAFNLSHHGRTAILDLDFHHGNGTQSIFYDQAQVIYLSLHGDPRYNYPYFSGFENETGRRLGKNCNFNFPLPAHTKENLFREKLKQALKIIKEKEIKYLVLSMGFDTYEKDEMGYFDLSADFYHEIGTTITKVNIPVLVCLEGGYQIEDLGLVACNFLDGFAEQKD
jgi:acetoin utilization deacetylase AcuC-like enzyme